MIPFYPFIHKKENKKEKFEPLPLYIEEEIPQIKPVKKEEEEQPSVTVIEIF